VTSRDGFAAIRFGRLIEVVPIVFVWLGVQYAGGFNAPALLRDDGKTIVLVSLAAWCIAPLVLRPLSYPGKSPNQRFALSSIIAAAGIVWWIWLMECLPNGFDPEHRFPVLVVYALLAAAIYVRIGWSPKAAPPKADRSVGP
jgi:hypothetical protein